MIGLAVLINAILLPILAQFGVFKGIHGHRDIPVELVKLPPPGRKPPAPKRRAAKPHPAAHKVAAHPPSERPSRPDPSRPKVVVAQGGNGPGDQPTVQQGTQPGGQLTTPPAPTPNPTRAPTPPPTPAPPTPAPTLPSTPAPTPSPAPHVPTLVAARPLSQPKPTVPDDLREQDVDTTFHALFTVHPDGTADVKMLNSTGNTQLDQLALDAARQWTFQPATEDGKPVESYLRLAIEFKVS